MTRQQDERKSCYHCMTIDIPLLPIKMPLIDNRREMLDILRCDCGQHWLHLFYQQRDYGDYDTYDDDIEIYWGPISPQVLETIPQGDENMLVWTLDVLSSLDWYYYHYAWKMHNRQKISGPFALMLMDHPDPLVKKWQKEHQGSRGL